MNIPLTLILGTYRQFLHCLNKNQPVNKLSSEIQIAKLLRPPKHQAAG